MPGTVHRDPELELLTELCRALAVLGLSVGLSDAAPAVMVRAGIARSLFVTVDASRVFFTWGDAEERHPVTDPVGAAARVAECITAADVGPGEGS